MPSEEVWWFGKCKEMQLEERRSQVARPKVLQLGLHHKVELMPKA